MYLLHGFKAIYTGVGGCILEKFLRLSCGFVIFEVLNRHYQEIGGNIDDLKDLNNLDNYQLFLIKLRTGIRETIQVVLCSVISRPFTVVAIRQIAQLIGNETKYLPINPFQPLLLIGAEEGPPGLFSGLMPVIVNGLISVWGTTICIYLVDIVYNKMVIKLKMKVEEDWENLHPYEKQQLAEHLQLCVLLRYNVCNLIVPSLVGFVQYPFKLCSNLMAAAGSGLLASLLPYSPTFNNWFDTYNYLAQNCELYRGDWPCLRREKGSIQVGPDNKLYGSKKHFI
ncbi:unnamed protein product [Meloidogyne enterolobii]|uniref:Uncharacterized protein n=1 Tax=Meloidogyne enterolobii TaxID=390850 RepID=A0ACB0YFW5_MELEN